MKKKIINLIILPAIFISTLWILLYFSPIFPDIKYIFLDELLNFRRESRKPSIAIIARDDQSWSYVTNSSEFSQYKENYAKWRAAFGKCLKRIHELQPLAIGFDFVFENAGEAVSDSIFINSVKELEDDDIPVVMASKIYETNKGTTMTKLFPKLAKICPNYGHINQQADDDGRHRSSTLIVKEEIDGKMTTSYSFALNLYMQSQFYETPSKDNVSVVNKNGYNYLKILKKTENDLREEIKFDKENDPSIDIESEFKKRIALTKEYIPVNIKKFNKDSWTASLNIRFFNPEKTNIIIPIMNIIDDSLWEKHKEEIAKRFTGCIFLFGPTALDDQDFVDTPLDISNIKRLSGIELHANALNTLMRGQPKAGNIFYKWINPKYEDLIFILLLIIAYFIFYFLKPFKSFISMIIIIILFLFFSVYLFNFNNIYMDFLRPIFGVLIMYFVALSVKFITSQKEKYQLKKMFTNYVNEAVVEELIKNPGMLKLGGEKRELSALFSDIAGFTSISEAMSPEGLVKLLNEYLSAMTDIVLDNQGLLDKYIGDAIMAFWGAPLKMDNHAEHACIVAVRMIEKLDILRKKWKKEKLPDVNIRIGINTGDMVVGNVGSTKRMDYTIMGDAVNLASRLEGTNKQYGTRILISEFTKAQVENKILTRELDSVRVKGKLKPVRIFEVLAIISELGENINEYDFIDIFEKGLECYRKQKWDDAIEYFKKTIEFRGEDPPSSIYIKRCEHFKKVPPGDDWDGVYVMTTK